MMSGWGIDPEMPDDQIDIQMQPILKRINQIYMLGKDDPSFVDSRRMRMLHGSDTFKFWEEEKLKNPEAIDRLANDMELHNVPKPK